MITNFSLIKRSAATVLLLLPIIMMLGLAMHFGSIHSFFRFRLSYGSYDAGGLFDALVAGKGHGFIAAHTVTALAVPMFFIVIFTLGWFLYQDKPVLALISVIIGIVGCTALAGVFGAWLSFTGIETVDKLNYQGARAGFIELARMKGVLKVISLTSYLAFVSIIMLAAGLIAAKKFEVWRMISLIVGSLLFILFMDMDNWMFIGSVLLLTGFIPIRKKLKDGVVMEN